MQSLNMTQIVNDGLAPLSLASKRLIHLMLDIDLTKEHSLNEISQFTNPFDGFSQQYSPSDNMIQMILVSSSFRSKNITALLRSAVMSGTASFRRFLNDFKITHRKIFAKEINQCDQHQNTLLWYLTVAGVYDSIKELYRLAAMELNVNVKNGQFNQTILHYAVVHGNLDEIRLLIDIGLDPNICDRLGRNALHYVALYNTKYENYIEIVQLLLDHTVPLNSEDYFNQTSLHLSILKQKYDLVEYLISLSNINVCIRDKFGYTSLCYLCKQILHLFETITDDNLSLRNLELILKIMHLIADRYSPEKLSDNFHVLTNNILEDNLLLVAYQKLISLKLSFDVDPLFDRFKSIIIGTNRDHYLYAEHLLNLHSWKSAVFALCNTHHVNISQILHQLMAHDSHDLLIKQSSFSSDSLMIFILVFYGLATDPRFLQNIVPMCKYTTKNQKETIDTNDNCSLYINNLNLYTDYTTFIHSCLHFANENIFTLKHLCRNCIRQHFQSHITDKIDECSQLELKYREYLKLDELLLIDSDKLDLVSIVHLIQCLYNIHHMNKSDLNQDQLLNVPKESLEVFREDVDADLVSDVSVESDSTENQPKTLVEDEELSKSRTSEQLTVASELSISNPSDMQMESKDFSSKPSIKEENISLETDRKSRFSLSDKQLSPEQFQNELANVQTKSKDIDDMIEKFLSKE